VGGRASGRARQKSVPAAPPILSAAERAATAPPTTLFELTAFLGRVIVETRDGVLGAQTAKALGYVASVLTKVIELGKLAEELQRLQEKLDEDGPRGRGLGGPTGAGADAAGGERTGKEWTPCLTP
jgi:hypothetical protein